MPGLAVNRITNANIFLNGKSMLGRAEEIMLPDLKAIMTEHKAIGMVGKLELIAGFEKLEAKIKWNSFYADAIKFIGNPYAAVQLQVRADVEGYDSTGRTAETALVTFLVGQFKNIPFGNFKQHDNVEFESNLNITSVKQIYAGATVIDYDVMSNKYVLNGVDLLAQYKGNIGQ